MIEFRKFKLETRNMANTHAVFITHSFDRNS